MTVHKEQIASKYEAIFQRAPAWMLPDTSIIKYRLYIWKYMEISYKSGFIKL
jgi:hypothetical protein